MLSKFSIFMLAITSVSPVFLTYAFILYLEDKSFIKILIVISILLICMLICLFLLKYSRQKLERMRFQIKKIRTVDSDIFSFFIAYLFPFISLDSNNINESVLIFILFMFVIIVLGTHSYSTNPILILFGYHFYEVSTPTNVTYLLMTKRNLRNVKEIKQIVQISDYMVLDTGEKRD